MAKADKQLLQMEVYKARQHELNAKMERLRKQMDDNQEEVKEEEDAADDNEENKEEEAAAGQGEVDPVQAAVNNARVDGPAEEEKAEDPQFRQEYLQERQSAFRDNDSLV